MTAAGIPALLEPIQERLPDIPESDMSRAEKDRARLLAAVQAVTALHAPQGEAYRTCSHCVRPSGYPNRPEQPERYPCPTVAAVVAALGGEA